MTLPIIVFLLACSSKDIEQNYLVETNLVTILCKARMCLDDDMAHLREDQYPLQEVSSILALTHWLDPTG